MSIKLAKDSCFTSKLSNGLVQTPSARLFVLVVTIKWHLMKWWLLFDYLSLLNKSKLGDILGTKIII